MKYEKYNEFKYLFNSTVKELAYFNGYINYVFCSDLSTACLQRFGMHNTFIVTFCVAEKLISLVPS